LSLQSDNLDSAIELSSEDDLGQQGIAFESHIVPWAECDDARRLDVDNGLPLSALWDAAFDKRLARAFSPASFAENSVLIPSS
jgi:hypothetical protein